MQILVVVGRGDREGPASAVVVVGDQDVDQGGKGGEDEAEARGHEGPPDVGDDKKLPDGQGRAEDGGGDAAAARPERVEDQREDGGQVGGGDDQERHKGPGLQRGADARDDLVERAVPAEHQDREQRRDREARLEGLGGGHRVVVEGGGRGAPLEQQGARHREEDPGPRRREGGRLAGQQDEQNGGERAQQHQHPLPAQLGACRDEEQREEERGAALDAPHAERLDGQERAGAAGVHAGYDGLPGRGGRQLALLLLVDLFQLVVVFFRVRAEGQMVAGIGEDEPQHPGDEHIERVHGRGDEAEARLQHVLELGVLGKEVVVEDAEGHHHAHARRQRHVGPRPFIAAVYRGRREGPEGQPLFSVSHDDDDPRAAVFLNRLWGGRRRPPL